MLIVITFIFLCALVFFILHFPEYRREILWAGILSLPLALLWAMSSYYSSQGNLSVLSNIGLRVVFGFSFAGVMATLYELLFYKHWKLKPHPHRAKLVQLLLGPIVFLLLALVFQSYIVGFLLLGFLVEVVILAYHQKQLLWEAVVSGLLMAVIYIGIFIIISSFASDGGLSLLVRGFSGIDVLGIPVEELIFVFGYGLLWGPLYEGVKREQL